jgi:hypothetical protein
MVTSQDSMRLREASKKRGVRFGTDLILKARERAYVNTEIFLEYIRMAFTPNLSKLRSLKQFADEDAVLLMDNYPSHVGEESSTIPRDAPARIIIRPPHTTRVFQELDMCLFGVLKRGGQYILPFYDDQTTAHFFFIYHTFRQSNGKPSRFKIDNPRHFLEDLKPAR